MANVQELRERGNEAFRRGDYEAAESLYSQAIAVSSENSDVLLTNRARTRLRREKHREATQDAQEALSINPNNVKAWSCLADASSALNNNLAAAEALERALGVAQPKDMAVLETRRVETITKMLRMARRDERLGQGPGIANLARVRAALGTCETDGSPTITRERASVVLNFANESRSTDPEWAEECCACLLVLSSPRSRNPDVVVWSVAACTLAGIRSGRIDEDNADASNELMAAIDLYRRAIHGLQALAVQRAGARSNLGQLYVRIGRLPEAIECYTQALSDVREIDEVTWAKIQRNLAIAYEKADRLRDAITALEQASPVLRSSAASEVVERAEHECLWGILCRKMGDTAGSERHLTNALQDFTASDRVADWARVQGEMAKTLETENLPRAELACREALALLVHDDSTHLRSLRAELQHTLASILSETPSSLEEAMSLYKSALVGFKPGTFNWAACQNSLGMSLTKRGSRTDLLAAVDCFELALSVFLPDGLHATQWAVIQRNLGNARHQLATTPADWATAELHFSASLSKLQDGTVEWAKTKSDMAGMFLDLPFGSPGSNAVRAVEAYEAALPIFTRDKHRREWCKTMNNLGTALRSVEDVAAQVRGIASLEEVVRLRREEGNIDEEVSTLLNLAISYKDFVGGSRSENLVKALDVIQQAKTRAASGSVNRTILAALECNMGIIYESQIVGSRADNLVKALGCYDEALRLYVPLEDWSLEWAMVQNNKGLALMWLSSLEGPRAKSRLESSISCFSEALCMYEKQNRPAKAAAANNNMALALMEMADVVPTALEEFAAVSKALNHYDRALAVFTFETHPEEHASAQGNLALAYVRLSRLVPNSTSQALSNAFQAYDKALSGFKTLKALDRWAKTMLNLGLAHNAAHGTELFVSGKAAECFKSALGELTEAFYPREWAYAQRFLAETLRASTTTTDDPLRREAVDCMSQSLRMLSRLRAQSLSGRSAQAESIARHARRLVGWLVEDGRITDAWEHAQRAKALNVADLVSEASMTSPASLDETDSSRYEKLTEQIRALRHSFARGDRVEAKDIEELERLHRERIDVIRRHDPDLAERLASPEARPVSFDELLSTFFADQRHAKAMLVDMVFGDEPPRAFMFCLSMDSCEKKCVQVLQRSCDRHDVEKALRLGPRSVEALRILRENLPLQELHALIGETKCTDVVFALHFIHAFPLHAIVLGNGGGMLADILTSVRFVPSTRVLVTVHERDTKRGAVKLFENYVGAAADPTHVMSGHQVEVRLVSALTRCTPLLETQVTVSALGFGKDPSTQLAPTTLHLACHGAFDPVRPYDGSGLLVYAPDGHGSDMIAVNDVFTQSASLHRCGVVVLSACSSALAPLSNGDELVGLPAAFLYAGASKVLASRWLVSDKTTALLFCRVFELLEETPQLDVWVALWRVQMWLRELSRMQRDDEYERRRCQLKVEASEQLAAGVRDAVSNDETQATTEVDDITIFSRGDDPRAPRVTEIRPAVQDDDDEDISSTLPEQDFEWTAFMCIG